MQHSTMVVETTHSLRECLVHMEGRTLRLELTLPPDALEPIFSGTAWAGTVIWPASRLLSERLRSHEETRRLVLAKDQRIIIELGAGLGVPGLTAALLGGQRVILTEKAPLAELLQRNVAKNLGLGCDGVVVEEVDWASKEAQKNLRSLRGSVKLVLVSDCIYRGLYGDGWKDLAGALEALCDAQTLVLNSVERRNDDGVEDFLAFCQTNLGIQWRKILVTSAGTMQEDSLASEMTGSSGECLELYEMFRFDSLWARRDEDEVARFMASLAL